MACAAAHQADQLSPKLQQVLSQIDEINSQDPRSMTLQGEAMPYELAYSRLLTEWVLTLTEDGDPPLCDELLIVARGQHIKRWTSPRSSYPEGRTAYLKWREDLKKMHANELKALMQQAGYSSESQAKVESMVLKKNLTKDKEAQTIEDALCLVFLDPRSGQFPELRVKESEEKMIAIIQKTWKKMSYKGHEEALGMAAALGDVERELVLKALA